MNWLSIKLALITVEKYDPSKPEKWQNVPDMLFPRSNFATAVIDDMLFVIGGFDGTRYLLLHNNN